MHVACTVWRRWMVFTIQIPRSSLDNAEWAATSSLDGLQRRGSRVGGRGGQGGFWKPVPRKLGAWRLCWAVTGGEGGRGNVMMGQTGACPVIRCSLRGWTRCGGNQDRSQALEMGRRGIKGRFHSLLSPARPALPSPPLGCLRGTSNLTRRTPHPHPQAHEQK